MNRYINLEKIEKLDKTPYYIVTAKDCGELLGTFTWSIRNVEYVFNPESGVIFVEYILAAISKEQKAINKADHEFGEDSEEFALNNSKVNQ